MEKEVIVRLADESKLKEALEFVRSVYAKKFDTQPESIWPICLVAETDEWIVGVMAMEFSDGTKFEVEDQFEFNFSMLLPPREKFVSFGRWVATQDGIGIALMFGAVRYALQQGKTHSLSCSKPFTLRALERKYGLEFDVLKVYIRGTIPEEDQNYFFSKPLPCLCVATLQQWYDRLKLVSPPSVRFLF